MTAKTNNLTCDCGKTCKTLAGLRAHQRFCKTILGDKVPITPPKIPNRPKTKADIIVQAKQDNPALTTRQLGKIAECSNVYAHEILHKYNMVAKEVDAFKKHAGDVWANQAGQILKSINPADYKKASLQQKIISAATAYDKYRLAVDKSTSNVLTVHADIKAMKEAHNRNKSNDTNVVP